MTSRWFRHYIGLNSDPKFAGVARRSRSTADRVIFVYTSALESACERAEAGAYTISLDGLAVACGCDTPLIRRILKELIAEGLLTKTHVVKWGDRQFESDSSRERVQRYREKKRRLRDVSETSGNGSVTLPKRDVAAQEADAESDTDTADAVLRPRELAGSDLDDLATRLRDASGLQDSPDPALQDLSPILGLMDAGFDLERSILPAIRARAATMRKPARSWAYFVGAVHDSGDRRIAAARPPQLRVVSSDTPASEMRPPSNPALAAVMGIIGE